MALWGMNDKYGNFHGNTCDIMLVAWYTYMD